MIRQRVVVATRPRWVTALILALLAGSLSPGWAYSVAKEIALGEEVSKEVEKEMPLSKNERWQKDAEEMGKRFVPLVKRKEIPYHFRIVETKDGEINAFALPGGYIYFTERMWRLLTPDERAAVMAHEITHSDRRHGIDMALKSQQRSLWMLPLIILSGGGAAGYALTVGDAIVSQRYSRKMEREADEMGIQLCKDAGYDPAGAVTSMKKLLHIQSDENHYEISGIFASHPDTLRRITYLAERAVAMGSDPDRMELKAVDDVSRFGNVTGKVSDIRLIHARTASPLSYGQKVTIKKMLWDYDKNALAPQTVAVAVVLTPGKFPSLLIEDSKRHAFSDVMVGDGVFPPDQPDPASEPATESPSSGETAKQP